MNKDSAAAKIEVAGDYYEEAEVLEFLGLKPATMSWRRSAAPDQVPPYIKLGRRIVYPKAEFHKWLDSRVVRFKPKNVR